MNGVTIFLIIFAILLTLIVVGVLCYMAYQSSITPSPINPDQPTSSCTNIAIPEQLLVIPETGANCIVGGQTGQYFYIGNLGDTKYDYVVTPYGTQALNVCIHFCDKGLSDGVCNGPNYNGRKAQENFDNCMKQLIRTDCTGPVPIAIKDSIYYYAYTPTCNTCSNCGATA